MAVIVFFFTLHLYVFWGRLPLTWVRACLLIALTGFLVRWVAALHFLAAPEVPVALLSSMVYIPMLLVVLSLMEGQRRSVAAGLAVAVIMGASLTLSAWRPELSAVHWTTRVWEFWSRFHGGVRVLPQRLGWPADRPRGS